MLLEDVPDVVAEHGSEEPLGAGEHAGFLKQVASPLGFASIVKEQVNACNLIIGHLPIPEHRLQIPDFLVVLVAQCEEQDQTDRLIILGFWLLHNRLDGLEVVVLAVGPADDFLLRLRRIV